MVLSLMAVLPALAGNLSIGALDLKVQGGSTSGGGYARVTQDTKIGTTLYVSNTDKAYNRVLVTVTHAAANTEAATIETVTITVTNSTTGATIGTGVTLTEDGVDTGIFTGAFLVEGTPSAADIGASDGTVVRVAYAATGDVVNMTVDGTKPVIAITSPVDDSITRATTVDFSGSVTDGASGVRSDVATGPGAGGPGAGAADGDGDAITANEPRTLGTGKTVDIIIRRLEGVDPASTFTDYTGDSSETAIWGTTTNGFTFISTRLLPAGEHRWNVQARDRAGNEAITDGDSTKTNSQPLKLTIDATAPAMASVETGKAWDATTKKEKTNVRNSLKVYFSAGGGAIGGTEAAPTGADKLDTTTVQATDFVVASSSTDSTPLAIASITHPNLKTATTGNPVIDTRHIVYITLVNDISSNAKPKVSLVGSLTDTAGNATSVADKTAIDKIAPKLTVTITGAGASRPIARGNAAGNEVVVRIVSDEPVTGTPTIDFTTFKYDDLINNADGNDQLEVAAVVTVVPSSVSGTTQTWETKQLNTAAGGFNGLVGVFVRATDINGVSGSTGTGGTATAGATVGTRADLTKANLLEFDNNLTAATLTLTPTSGGTTTTTESRNPFVRIDFAEGSEYSIFTTGGVDPATATAVDKFDCGAPTTGALAICVANKAGGVGTNPTTVEVDAHNTITLTTVTLNGVDVSASVGTIDSDSFVLATSNLALGTHTLAFNGTDAVGNTYTGNQEFAITVVERSEYSIPLSPGWNLVSFPGDPTDPSLDAVLPSSHPALTVLSYDPSDPNGPWLSAVRGSGGTWTGTLSNVTSTRAYWVQTGAFTPIKTLIPERSTASELPTIPVVAGWNLVPVVDLQLTTAPPEASLKPTGGPPVTTAPASGIDPDLYFASVTWTVAYGFDTQANQWRKVTPGVPGNLIDNVGQGKGYWIWVTKDGTLVP